MGGLRPAARLLQLRVTQSSEPATRPELLLGELLGEVAAPASSPRVRPWLDPGDPNHGALPRGAWDATTESVGVASGT